MILPLTIGYNLLILREIFNAQINEAVFSLQDGWILPDNTVLSLELLHWNLWGKKWKRLHIESILIWGPILKLLVQNCLALGYTNLPSLDFLSIKILSLVHIKESGFLSRVNGPWILLLWCTPRIIWLRHCNFLNDIDLIKEIVHLGYFGFNCRFRSHFNISLFASSNRRALNHWL